MTASPPVPSTAPAPPDSPFRTIAGLIGEHAAARPGHTALQQGETRLSYGELDRLLDRVAAALQRDGIVPGEAIAICATPSPRYAAVYLGALRAGVAVAPVTDFRNYDSVYTERYLGLPSASDSPYPADASVTSAANLKGRLLLAQGTGDDNVHLSNIVQFIDPLIEAGIPYDLQIFPRKTHSIAGFTARTELFNRILYQFETYLK